MMLSEPVTETGANKMMKSKMRGGEKKSSKEKQENISLFKKNQTS